LTYIYDHDGDAVGFILGRYIYSIDGNAVAELIGERVHGLSGEFLGDLYPCGRISTLLASTQEAAWFRLLLPDGEQSRGPAPRDSQRPVK